jgi:hypothetical protein
VIEVRIKFTSRGADRHEQTEQTPGHQSRVFCPISLHSSPTFSGYELAPFRLVDRLFILLLDFEARKTWSIPVSLLAASKDGHVRTNLLIPPSPASIRNLEALPVYRIPYKSCLEDALCLALTGVNHPLRSPQTTLVPYSYCRAQLSARLQMLC